MAVYKVVMPKVMGFALQFVHPFCVNILIKSIGFGNCSTDKGR